MALSALESIWRSRGLSSKAQTSRRCSLFKWPTKASFTSGVTAPSLGASTRAIDFATSWTGVSAELAPTYPCRSACWTIDRPEAPGNYHPANLPFPACDNAVWVYHCGHRYHRWWQDHWQWRLAAQSCCSWQYHHPQLIRTDDLRHSRQSIESTR